MNLDHSAMPPSVSRPWIAIASIVWAGAALFAHLAAPAEVSQGPVAIEGRVIVGPVESRFGRWVLIETMTTVVLVDLGPRHAVQPGAEVTVVGRSDGRPGNTRGRAYAAKVRADDVVVGPGPSLAAVGEAVSSHVMRRLEPFDTGRGLLAGFLIGDTSRVSDVDVEAMRLSGLAHFVAVSGSNVALFLLLLFVATGPLAMGPKRRAAIGMVGLPIYAAATRFEPSVIRASLMAGVALAGRIVGVVLEAWQLLSIAVVVLLVLDPHLTSNVGFQLSVVATAGVLVGVRWPMRGGPLSRALAVTLGAQVAVAPLLLIHFGSVPLMSPVINLLAAPLVAVSTTIGAVGVVGPGFLVDLAAFVADLVLAISRAGSTFPQLGFWGLVGVSALGLVLLRWPRLAPTFALVGSVAVVSLLVIARTALPDSTVVVLDVGQGDSILIHGGDGRFALVDGGPDALVLQRKLRRYGVRSLELVVLTHVHADHAVGLAGLGGVMSLGTVWANTEPHSTTASRRFLESTSFESPQVGDRFRLGSLDIEVIGPLRRYASPNDQSLVVKVVGEGRSILLSGDIETIAQAELAGTMADVLKVPHQGAATSDPDWLRSVGARLAVISVGPNSFGHPADWVIAELEASGATVIRTDEAGDVVVPLS